MKFYLALLIAPLTLNLAQAHGVNHALPKTGIELALSIAYHSDDAVEAGSPWLIPGINLGGEALPTERGMSLDDATLGAHYQFDSTYAVSTRLAAHEHDGESDVELENLGFIFDVDGPSGATLIELGLMTTETTQTASYHAAQSAFGEAPLLSDAFFGRHFNDTGVRLKLTEARYSAGVELWSGDSWPMRANEGAASLFAKVRPGFDAIQIELGAWAMSGEASNRNDARYGDGHSHGGLSVESPAAEIFFDGDIELLGVTFSAGFQLADWRFFTELEWIEMTQQGSIRDNGNQSSGIESTYEGASLMLGAETRNHQFSILHEELRLENLFADSVNLLFLERSGLSNNGFDPSKTMVSWQWRFKPDFRLRVEWVDDQGDSETSDTRTALGLSWHKTLL